MNGTNYVPNMETRYYEVHPRQLAWAMHALSQVPGYSVQGYSKGQGGMMLIAVSVPPGAPPLDWATVAGAPSARGRWLRFDRTWLVRIGAILLGLYIVYGLLAGGGMGGLALPEQYQVFTPDPAVVALPNPVGDTLDSIYAGAVTLGVFFLVLIIVMLGLMLRKPLGTIGRALRRKGA
jgi:hypothetical protein